MIVMTFRNKHFFRSGFLRAAIFAWGACVLGSCTEIAEPQDIGSTDKVGRMPLALRATVSDYTAIGKEDTPSTRIPTEDGFSTKFSEGDAIGIFALAGFETPDVTPVDGVQNLKLVCTKAADGTVSWVPADDTKALYSYDDDIVYVAYYPYRDGITIKGDNKESIFKDLAANSKL